MRNFALGLAALGLIALAASTASAAGPHHGPATPHATQLAAHHGSHGGHHGLHGRQHRYYGPPRVVVPVPRYYPVPSPRIVRPPVYREYYYSQPPRYYGGGGGSIQFYGPRGGISIGW